MKKYHDGRIRLNRQENPEAGRNPASGKKNRSIIKCKEHLPYGKITIYNCVVEVFDIRYSRGVM